VPKPFRDSARSDPPQSERHPRAPDGSEAPWRRSASARRRDAKDWLAIVPRIRDGVGSAIIAWVELTGEVAAYFRHWLDDATYQTVDEDNVPYFAEDEDDVTPLLSFNSSPDPAETP
jgi:hypothetical protein